MHVAGVGVSLLKGSAQAHPEALRLATHGPVGDRRYCLVDLAHRDGPRVLRTVQNPPLLRLRAHEESDVLTVEVPGPGPLSGPVSGPVGPASRVARVVHGDYWGRSAPLEVLAGPWAAALSAYLGREVVLARARPRDVVYGGGVTLVTTSTLAELARRARAAGHDGAPQPDDVDALVADAERFRATAVVATPGADAFCEDDWTDREVRLGDADDDAVVVVRGPVPRCAVVRMRPGDGRRDPWDPLALLAPDRTRDTATGREVVTGVEAEVVRPGLVRVGARVALAPGGAQA